ncbi:uncharacterized protein LOC117590567 [Drosophila guanche]|uniref:uncharacterized protein LOC117590567 n=1 Tax=Drosophila guanche TaxID=7266 RepID=UPI001471DAFF|nr:uncharacterized protein LOC117590567 [Drosophila guanche]
MKSESKTLHRISPKGEQQRTADHPLPLRSAEAAAQPSPASTESVEHPALSPGHFRRKQAEESVRALTFHGRVANQSTERPIADNDESGKWSFQRANASSDRLRLRDMDLVC